MESFLGNPGSRDSSGQHFFFFFSILSSLGGDKVCIISHCNNNLSPISDCFPEKNYMQLLFSANFFQIFKILWFNNSFFHNILLMNFNIFFQFFSVNFFPSFTAAWQCEPRAYSHADEDYHLRCGFLCRHVSPDVIPCGWLGLKHQLTN